MSFSAFEIAVEYSFLNITYFFSMSFSLRITRYAVFKVLGGLKWTRTTDLTLIRRALYPAEL